MRHNQNSHSHKKDAKSSIYTYVWWLAGRRVTLHTLYFLRMVPQWVTSTFRPDERRRSNLHHYTDTTGQFTAQHKTNIGLRVFSTTVNIMYQSKFQNIIYAKINFQTACIQKNKIVTSTEQLYLIPKCALKYVNGNRLLIYNIFTLCFCSQHLFNVKNSKTVIL